MATESILNLHMKFLLVGSCCFCLGDSASIGPLWTLDVTVWTVAILIVLAVGVVLRSQMPIQTKQVEIVSILIMKWTYVLCMINTLTRHTARCNTYQWTLTGHIALSQKRFVFGKIPLTSSLPM